MTSFSLSLYGLRRCLGQELQKLQRLEQYEKERISLEKELNQSKQKILMEEIDNERIRRRQLEMESREVPQRTLSPERVQHLT